jgi:hypothetical protein
MPDEVNSDIALIHTFQRQIGDPTDQRASGARDKGFTGRGF